MSRARKGWLIAAIILIITGAVIFTGAFAALGFDFEKISTAKYEENTYAPGGDFDKISIVGQISDISFMPTDGKGCRVVCREREKLRHSVTVRNRTLIIDTKDTRKWYDNIGINFGTESVTVYLPKAEYSSLFIETDTGGIKIPSGFTFKSVDITTDTADIVCGGITADSVKIRTDTGGIRLNTADISGAAYIESEVGTAALTDVDCGELIAKNDIGNVILKNVIAKSSFSIESDVGDIEFENCDAQTISVKTDVGSVTGTLLSDKVFIVQSSVGDVDVPKTLTGGKCEITTDVGDVKISVV